VVVLGVPMYNFGVPAALKNWIDAISRAKVTFQYTANGPEGLLKGKKVYVALTRGGQYRNTPADTQVPYLKTVLSFLGMTDLQFVYAEGLAMGPDAEQKALASARAQIEELTADGHRPDDRHDATKREREIDGNDASNPGEPDSAARTVSG
jgi:FMN-dependent NADH-azoreductase